MYVSVTSIAKNGGKSLKGVCAFSNRIGVDVTCPGKIFLYPHHEVGLHAVQNQTNQVKDVFTLATIGIFVMEPLPLLPGELFHR